VLIPIPSKGRRGKRVFVTVYRHKKFVQTSPRDAWTVVNDNVKYVGPDWNDQISSIKVHAGHWQFYYDRDFHDPAGPVLVPGEYPWVEDLQIGNDRISSFQCVG
jgi:hypothetical protein